MAKLKAKQIVDIQDSIFQPTGSVESTAANLSLSGSLVVTSSVVDFTGTPAISGSTFSGSFAGSGAGLTGIPSTGIDGQLGIFAQTGSIQATTNNIEITGSTITTGEVTASSGIRVVGDSVVAGDLQVNDDLIVSQYISHKGDANTRINFTDDRIQTEIGGITFVGMHKKDSQPHLITFNSGGNHIDVQIKDNDGDTLFRTDADSDNVLFPDAVKISGSAASTGSFGLLQGDGSELTGITSGIFQTTGSIEATTNDIEVTGQRK